MREVAVKAKGIGLRAMPAGLSGKIACLRKLWRPKCPRLPRKRREHALRAATDD